jgi:hypothetical protein
MPLLSGLLLRSFKSALTKVGANVSPSTLHQAQMAVNYMRLGQWVDAHGYRFGHRVRNRTKVFDVVAQRVGKQEVLYLEFGVFMGASMRYWSNALTNPASKLHGFDSFEGLPEEFDMAHGKERFNVGGVIPKIDDPRVQFFKGWFSESLPKYTVPEHETLVICMDADLYSSTIFVLRHLRPWIRKGTYIYFDDMSRPEHEPRAFDEFMAETGRAFEPVAADVTLNTAFFLCRD